MHLAPPSLTIRKYGDPVLRRQANPVESLNKEVLGLIPAMFHAMYAEPGIGLAAPQVGVSLRFMVMDLQPGGKPQPLVLINPKIAEKKGKIDSEEGCLSLPGITITIPRAEWVRVAAINEKGLPVNVAGEGLLSRCLQHEMDHLDGVLMIDHLSLSQRLKVLWEIRQRKKDGRW